MKQFDIFGNDITEQVIQEEKKRKNSERAKKAAETRKKNKAEKEALFDKMFIIARSEYDLLYPSISSYNTKEGYSQWLSNLLVDDDTFEFTWKWRD